METGRWCVSRLQFYMESRHMSREHIQTSTAKRVYFYKATGKLFGLLSEF